jgi:hypothetical protein
VTKVEVISGMMMMILLQQNKKGESRGGHAHIPEKKMRNSAPANSASPTKQKLFPY